MSVSFFRKRSKFNVGLKDAGKKWEEMFCFWDKCIWLVYIELSLLIREYLLSAVIVLTNSFKTFHVTKTDLSNLITFIVINQYGKDAGIKIESVLGPVQYAACGGVLSNESF